MSPYRFSEGQVVLFDCPHNKQLVRVRIVRCARLPNGREHYTVQYIKGSLITSAAGDALHEIPPPGAV